jgi:hypothetical protein
VLAGSHQADVLAEPILQLSKADLLHGPNVASWGHIVNARPRRLRRPAVCGPPSAGRCPLVPRRGLRHRTVVEAPDHLEQRSRVRPQPLERRPHPKVVRVCSPSGELRLAILQAPARRSETLLDLTDCSD